MAKGMVKTEDGARLLLDDLMRELSAEAVEMTKMLGLPSIERHEPTEMTFIVRTRADQVATLKDDSVSHIEWQLKHDDDMGRRMLETYLGIKRRLKPKGPIHQVVVRVGDIRNPEPVYVDIAGTRHEVKVLTGHDLDLEPLFASPHISDKVIACVLTPDLRRLEGVANHIAALPEADAAKAWDWFLRVAMFRQFQDGLPPETTKVIDTVIEIDIERNPLTARAFAKAMADRKLADHRNMIFRLLEGRRELTATELDTLNGMGEDDLDSVFEAAVAFVSDPSDDEAVRSLDAALNGGSPLKL